MCDHQCPVYKHHDPQQVLSCPARFIQETTLSPGLPVHICPHRPATPQKEEKWGMTSLVLLTLGLCAVVFLAHTMISIKAGVGEEQAQNLQDTLEISRSKRDIPNLDVEDSLEISHPESYEKQTTNDKCRTGHIQGLAPFCDPHGCLLKLNKNNIGLSSIYHDPLMDTNLNISDERVIPMPTFKTKLQKQLLFVSMLSAVQWDMGIYGSIGMFQSQEHTNSFGDYFTSTAGRHFGERIFKWSISKTFDRSAKYKASSGPVKSHTVSFEGHHLDLSKKFFVDSDIPQFRMIGISESNDMMSMVSGLERATCLLRDGGILVVEGSEGGNSASANALNQYFNKHGNAALTPCLKIKNRYFLCTTNWKDRIIKEFLSNKKLSQKYLFKKEMNNAWGIKHSYLSLIIY